MEEMRNENWEAITPPENSQQEMENIRRNLKKQNSKLKKLSQMHKNKLMK